MSVKVAVVTGSNKGIGFATVRGLCKQFDGDVILTARNETLGKAAVEILQKEGLNPKFHQLDITKMESIMELKAFLQSQYGGLDLLVNNASIYFNKEDPTPFSEQAEKTISVNFHGTFDVCQKLFPLLRPHSRVVNVTSSAGKLSRIPGEELRKKFLSENLNEWNISILMHEFVSDVKGGNHLENGWGDSPYVVSKVGISALTFAQQRMFDGESFTLPHLKEAYGKYKDPYIDTVINAVHPGYVDTDMTDHKGPLTPDQGAEPILYCALLPPDIEAPRGQFIWCDKTVVGFL